jgi:exosortase
LSLIENTNWSQPAQPSISLARRHALFLLFSAVLLVITSGSILALIAYASDLENKNASQIFLIPFISATLLVYNRKSVFARVHYAVVPGTLTILAGIGLLATAGAWDLKVEGDRLAVSISAIIVIWLGGYLFFYGPAAFKTALFPLLFLAFSIPIPSFILDPSVEFLRRGSADIAYGLLKLSGTPIFREGFVFALPKMTIEVAPECSGIRSCIGMLILSIIGGYSLLETQWNRIVLVLVAIPIMIFKNAVRIATLTLLAVHVDPRIIESRLHREGGIPFFLVALLLIYPFLVMLMKSERRKAKGKSD